MAQDNDKILRDAQYRKGLSIAFFNATNAAIALVAAMPEQSKTESLAKVVEYRNFFLEEHKNYYAAVIANVGKNYDAAETVKMVEAATDLENLKQLWLGMSEDERQDPLVVAAKEKVKKQYEKA